MSFSSRSVPAVLLTILSLTATLFAQSSTQQTTKTPRGSISGRVTTKDKGFAGVVMGLRKSDGMSMGVFEPFLKATTDHDGYYRFNNVAPGNYEVTPSAPAYVMASAGTGNIGPIGLKSKGVVVGEDENVDGINFSLVKGGVITGRVTDADGDQSFSRPSTSFVRTRLTSSHNSLRFLLWAMLKPTIAEFIGCLG